MCITVIPYRNTPNGGIVQTHALLAENSLGINDMDRLQAIELFIRVVDLGSFSKAALDMGMGQPSATKLVAALEKSLGSRLLHRTTHGVTPTESGALYYDKCKLIAHHMDEAQSVSALLQSQVQGLHLRLAAARQEQKELKMRSVTRSCPTASLRSLRLPSASYNIGQADFEVRFRAAQRFLKDGDKVRLCRCRCCVPLVPDCTPTPAGESALSIPRPRDGVQADCL